MTISAQSSEKREISCRKNSKKLSVFTELQLELVKFRKSYFSEGDQVSENA